MKDLADVEDGLLVQRVAEADVAAYRELVRRHGPRLLRFVGGLLRDSAESEDIVQETFLRLWQRASDYTPTGGVASWLYRIAHNLAVDRMRQRGRLKAFDEDELPPDSAPQPLYIEAKRRQVALDRALESLPQRQAAAITLVHLDGMTGAEAAGVLGVSEEALESLLARGRRALKDKLLRTERQPSGNVT